MTGDAAGRADGGPLEIAPIVVTRLAISGIGGVPPDESWIRARVDLLRRVGWPSLRLSGPGIAWVLLVDPERRALVADLVADLVLDGGAVHLAEGTGFAPTTAQLRPDRVVHPGSESFVTIRMDSDDALLPGSVAALREAAAGSADATLLDLPRGYQLDLDTGRLVEAYYRRWRQGPFLALVHRSRATMLDTGGEHTGARADREVRHLSDPAWVQTIHGTNVSNRLQPAPVAVRIRRLVGARSRADARAAWVDGRVVGDAETGRILAAAGITLG